MAFTSGQERVTKVRERQTRRDIGVLRNADRKDTLGRMSLFDKGSDVSESLRKLVLGGGGQDVIDLTEEGSPFIIDHNPSSCAECTGWYKEVRTIGEAHRDLFDQEGFVKGPSLSALEIEQQQRLQEIAQLVESHLKKVHDDELARKQREASENDQFRW